MNIIQTVVIAIVEGLTEFLPISSTGHMIIAGKILGVPEDEFTKLFEIAIQLGAILAVVILYWRKFFDFNNWQLYVKLIVGVIPAIILGLLFSKKIDALLESTTTVAVALLVGGVVLIFIDKFFNHPRIQSERQIPFSSAFMIGLWQCLAMIPGVSRSAASIIGGMQQKLTRSAAAEFSFFLAVPTMLAATGYKLLKFYNDSGGFTGDQVKLLLLGNVIALVVAMFAIKFFIEFLKKHGFRVWGIYRVILGIILLVLIYTGHLTP
ncbi:MAG: undecaprenyl-diphosphate phosphatase [Ginsengibacter sp.]